MNLYCCFLPLLRAYNILKVLLWRQRLIGQMAAKHSYGNIGEFDQAVENWDAYIERMEQYFLANDITADAKKKAILLSTCGPSTYSRIRSLAAPDKPTALEYSALLELTKKTL